MDFRVNINTHQIRLSISGIRIVYIGKIWNEKKIIFVSSLFLTNSNLLRTWNVWNKYETGVSKGVSRYLFSIQALNHISHTYLLTNQSQNTMEWQIQTWYHSLDINCQGRIWINLYEIYWDIHTKKYPHCKKIAKYTKRKIPASHQGIPKK